MFYMNRHISLIWSGIHSLSIIAYILEHNNWMYNLMGNKQMKLRLKIQTWIIVYEGLSWFDLVKVSVLIARLRQFSTKISVSPNIKLSIILVKIMVVHKWFYYIYHGWMAINLFIYLSNPNCQSQLK